MKVPKDSAVEELNLVNTMVNNTILRFYSKMICNFATWIRWFYFTLVNFCRQVGDSAVWLYISLLQRFGQKKAPREEIQDIYNGP